MKDLTLDQLVDVHSKLVYPFAQYETSIVFDPKAVKDVRKKLLGWLPKRCKWERAVVKQMPANQLMELFCSVVYGE